MIIKEFIRQEEPRMEVQISTVFSSDPCDPYREIEYEGPLSDVPETFWEKEIVATGISMTTGRTILTFQG